MAFAPERKPSFAALADAPIRFRYTEPRVHRVLVDGLTARAVILCHENGNDETKAKIERMCAGTWPQFNRLAAFCFKFVSF